MSDAAALHPFLEQKLNAEQRRAVVQKDNCVVSAGAGSGKTFVLSRRFAHLVVDEGMPVDGILTLTFTNKAASEMYERIYKTLAQTAEHCEPDSEQYRRVKTALADFHKARIQTLDSYCAFLLRTSARFYGIRPDFTVDCEAVDEYVQKQALLFALEHRNSNALRVLSGTQDIHKTACDFFAGAVLKYSVLAHPFDFNSFIDKQIQKLKSMWDCQSHIAEQTELCPEVPVRAADIERYVQLMREERQSAVSGTQNAVNRQSDWCANFEQRMLSFFDELYVLQKQSARGKKGSAVKTLRSVYGVLSGIANYLLHFADMLELIPLVELFERRINDWKRSSGILTFADVSSLALRILIEHPDIRCAEKKRISAIMIDEFQDNNEDQRDMLFLLAETPQRTEKSVPRAHELCPDKLFFVGDEKQSIYSFRGADVGVFRKLKSDLNAQSLFLSANYRSSFSLVAAFNSLFGGFSYPDGTYKIPGAYSVFIQDYQLNGDEKLPPFEAEYTKVCHPEQNASKPPQSVHSLQNALTSSELSPNLNRTAHKLQDAPIHVCVLDTDSDTAATDAGATAANSGTEAGSDALAKADAGFDADASTGKAADLLGTQDDEFIRSEENEAVFVAEKIASLIQSKRYRAQDIAVLFRSYTSQLVYEKHLRLRGVPYTAENVVGFFADAPVNDMYYFLRLIVYPQDLRSFAAVLRSPFVRLSERAVLLCLSAALERTKNDEHRVLFCADNAIALEADDAYRFTLGMSRYENLRRRCAALSCAETVNLLWYNEGYRFETLWNKEGMLFSQLYDYLYELARSADSRGETLTDFVEYLSDLERTQRRLDGMDLPLEQKSAVRLMSIHKSKGLEFPVVFLCGTSSRAKTDTNTDKMYADKEWGISFNFPPPRGIKECTKNFFFDYMACSAARKSDAELRRLLYVALTRAEKELYISASYSLNQKARDLLEAAQKNGFENNAVSKYMSEYSSQELFCAQRLCALFDSKTETVKNAENLLVKPEFYVPNGSFFALLLPFIAFFSRSTDGCCPFTLELIPRMSRQDIARLSSVKKTASLQDVQKQLAFVYKNVPVLTAPVLPSPYRNPSKLCETLSSGLSDVLSDASEELIGAPEVFTDPSEGHIASPEQGHAQFSAQKRLAVDDIIQSIPNGAFGYEDFGTIAQAFTEAAFTGKTVHIPAVTAAALNTSQLKTVTETAQKMAEGFVNSSLGQKAKNAVWRKNEYAFKLLLTKAKNGEEQDSSYVIVNGTMDLVYENKDGSLVVVDFKTDFSENPENHIVQLASYRRAAALMRHKNPLDVHCFLYYFRTGHAVDISAQTEQVDLEKIVFE